MTDRIFAAYWLGATVGAMIGAVVGYGIALERNAAPAPALSRDEAIDAQIIRLPPVRYGGMR